MLRAEEMRNAQPPSILGHAANITPEPWPLCSLYYVQYYTNRQASKVSQANKRSVRMSDDLAKVSEAEEVPTRTHAHTHAHTNHEVPRFVLVLLYREKEEEGRRSGLLMSEHAQWWRTETTRVSRRVLNDRDKSSSSSPSEAPRLNLRGGGGGGGYARTHTAGHLKHEGVA